MAQRHPRPHTDSRQLAQSSGDLFLHRLNPGAPTKLFKYLAERSINLSEDSGQLKNPIRWSIAHERAAI
jgi:hypothetical protein